MRLASDSPMPHPLFFVEKPGSKMRPRSSRGTPGPSSATAITTPSSPLATPTTRMCPPRPASASMAFLVSTSTAHSSSTGSPLTRGRFGVDRRLDRRSCWRASARAPGNSARSDSRSPATSTGSNFGSRPMRSNRCATRSSRSRSPRMCVTAACAVSSFARSSSSSIHPRETRERRAELVRRFARHAGPQSLARRVVPRANDVEAGDAAESTAVTA